MRIGDNSSSGKWKPRKRKLSFEEDKFSFLKRCEERKLKVEDRVALEEELEEEMRLKEMEKKQNFELNQLKLVVVVVVLSSI